MIILFLLLHIISIFQAKCIHIADGDTITVLDNTNTQIKVRLHGIDCPESHQDYGNVAKEFTAKFCKGKSVTIVHTDDDRYGRMVGLVIVGKDTLNTELLKAGLAWHYNRYDSNPVWQHYQDGARENKKGLWAQPEPVEPWEWRKSKGLRVMQAK